MALGLSETGRIRFRRARFQTPNSVSFFGPHRVPERELSEFLSACDLRAYLSFRGASEFTFSLYGCDCGVLGAKPLMTQILKNIRACMLGFFMLFAGKLHSELTILEARKPTQNPETPKKDRVWANFFEKFAWAFGSFLVTRVRHPAEIVQKYLFRWTFLFRVDFLGWIFLPWNFTYTWKL